MTTRTDPETCWSRRTVLHGGVGFSLLAGAGGRPAASPVDPADKRTLVLLHLSGGNDGFDTLVPFADPLYCELRPRLRRTRHEVIPIAPDVGLPPAMVHTARMYDQGRMAIVQGVGSAEPDYRHTEACRAWARGGRAGGEAGWWDDVVSRSKFRDRPVPVCLGGRPRALLASPDRLRHAATVAERQPVQQPLSYAAGAIERTLATASRVACLHEPPPLVLATVGGFDTHGDQRARRDRLLGELDDGFRRFAEETARRGRSERVLLVAWSEFGRRLAENSAGGTDHGTAGVAFVIGGGVPGGLYGRPPAPDPTDAGNVVATTDIAALYRFAAGWLCGVAEQRLA